MNRLGCKGEGFKMLMNKLQQERLLVAMLGLSRASLIYDWAHVFFVNQKQQSSSQSVLFALAEMLTDIKIGRTFMDHLIIQHMDGADISVETSMAKYWMTDLANKVANRCLDMVGTTGLTEACPIVRTFRDVRVMPIFAGTNEIMKTIIAKKLVCH
jgi:alkylation response protein AidB-like acyl-CoA dehydrogenase